MAYYTTMSYPPHDPYQQFTHFAQDGYPVTQSHYAPLVAPHPEFQSSFQESSPFPPQQMMPYALQQPSQYPVEQPSPAYTSPAYTPGPHIMQYLSPAPSHTTYSPSNPQPQTLPAVGRAVVIGVNYFNQKGEMRGRVDEARNLARYLEQVKGYQKENIMLLTDDQNGPNGQPTKRNILGALFWLAKHAQQGEKLVLYYSGHGRVSTQKKNGQKSSRKRSPPVADDDIETIYPVDFRSFKEGMIKPSELEEILRPAREKGAKLTIILDAHTGQR